MTNESDAPSEQSDDARECLKERDSAFETANNQQAEYDKQLLTLSAGFLALSLAFVKDVVPLHNATFLWALYVSFCANGASVLLVLISYQYSIHGHFKLVKYWERKYEGLFTDKETKCAIEEEQFKRYDQLKNFAQRVRALNIGSGLVFIFAAILLIIFVMVNIHREAGSERKAQSVIDSLTHPATTDTGGCTMNVTLPSAPTSSGDSKSSKTNRQH